MSNPRLPLARPELPESVEDAIEKRNARLRAARQVPGCQRFVMPTGNMHHHRHLNGTWPVEGGVRRGTLPLRPIFAGLERLVRTTRAAIAGGR